MLKDGRKIIGGSLSFLPPMPTGSQYGKSYGTRSVLGGAASEIQDNLAARTTVEITDSQIDDLLTKSVAEGC